MTIDDALQDSRLGRILVFDTDYPGAFPVLATSLQRKNLTRLREIDALISAETGEQDAAKRFAVAATGKKNLRLSAIKADLTDLSIIADGIDDPDFDYQTLFSLPVNARESTWIAQARTTGEKLTPHLALFAEFGLAPDFIADLTADLAAYDSDVPEQDSTDGARSASTKGIAALIEEQKRLVKQLDTYAQIRQRQTHAAMWNTWDVISKLGDARKAHRAATKNTATTKNTA